MMSPREDRRVHVVQLEVRSFGTVVTAEVSEQLTAFTEVLVEARVERPPMRVDPVPQRHEGVDDQVVVAVRGVVAQGAVMRQVVPVEDAIPRGAQLRSLHFGCDE